MIDSVSAGSPLLILAEPKFPNHGFGRAERGRVRPSCFMETAAERAVIHGRRQRAAQNKLEVAGVRSLCLRPSGSVREP